MSTIFVSSFRLNASLKNVQKIKKRPEKERDFVEYLK
jgi:hypothetical protein